MYRKPGEILLELSHLLGISIPELARMSSYQRPQAFYDVINEKTKNITMKMADNIVRAFPQVNRNTLICGEGELIDTEARPAKSHYMPYVPLLPISAQGGSLNEFMMSVKSGDCEKVLSPIREADFAVTVTGDSMAPEFPCGSQVLIKKINMLAFIEWGKTYVLDTCNGTVIKKVAPSEREGWVRCLSVNTAPEFAPFDIKMEDIYGFYRVLLCMAAK